MLTSFLTDLLQQLEASKEEYVVNGLQLVRELGEPETPDESRIQLHLIRKVKHLEKSVNEMDFEL